MSTTAGMETAVLTLVRFSFFYACRKYLLRSLYSDLKSLSVIATPGTPNSSGPTTTTTNVLFNAGTDDVELESLPNPTTYTPKTSKFSIDDTTYLHTAVSRTIFSWCFAESCMMFCLLMLQGAGIFTASARLLNWKISLFVLMSAILVIIPLSVSLLLSIGATDGWTIKSIIGPRAILSFIPVALYLFALSYIPLPASLEPADTFTVSLSRLIVLGTIVLGLLSGFGAISSSWQFLPFVSRPQSIPTERDIENAQYSLMSIRNDLRDRRTEAARRAGTSQTDSSWLSRVGASFRGSDSLTQEIQGLEALEYQMTRNLDVLRERYASAKYAGTFRGRIFNTMGRLFMVYCVIRVISSIYNVIFLPSLRTSSSTTYPDLMTDLLDYTLSHLSSVKIDTEDLASFSRQISLFLVGIIILSSIRLVLRGATRTHADYHSFSYKNIGVARYEQKPSSISHAPRPRPNHGTHTQTPPPPSQPPTNTPTPTQLNQGMYLLSTLVQMRSSFPPPPPPPSHPSSSTDAAPENLFSTIPQYELFGALFDWSFLVAAGASVFVRWGAERVNGHGEAD
uniref:Golgi pH regulator n=1 Tax=Psilocybe cubensis TaxID=181762 RepID=A0A8H7XX95_PSICU